MKLLVIFAAAFLLLWLLRRDFLAARRRRQQHARPAAPQAMVRCDHCGLHLPQADALPGRRAGHYCCAEHRRAAD